MAAVIEFEQVEAHYGSRRALAGVSFQVQPGHCLAVVGESGSGKTTMLRLILRLLDASAGTIRLHGRDIRELDRFELRRGIGYVPQDGGLMPHWRVDRNVELVPALRRASDPAALARAALDLAGLSDAFARRWPHELSGGQRQRVALARALAGKPALLLLDEPFGALDAITRAEVQSAFADVLARTGTTAILVTHDLAEAARLAQQIIVLRNGRIEQAAAPAMLFQQPATEYVRALVDPTRALLRLGAP